MDQTVVNVAQTQFKAVFLSLIWLRAESSLSSPRDVTGPNFSLRFDESLREKKRTKEALESLLKTLTLYFSDNKTCICLLRADKSQRSGSGRDCFHVHALGNETGTKKKTEGSFPTVGYELELISPLTSRVWAAETFTYRLPLLHLTAAPRKKTNPTAGNCKVGSEVSSMAGEKRRRRRRRILQRGRSTAEEGPGVEAWLSGLEREGPSGQRPCWLWGWPAVGTGRAGQSAPVILK